MVNLSLTGNVALIGAPMAARAVKHAAVGEDVEGLLRILGGAEVFDGTLNQLLVSLEIQLLDRLFIPDHEAFITIVTGKPQALNAKAIKPFGRELSVAGELIVFDVNQVVIGYVINLLESLLEENDLLIDHSSIPASRDLESVLVVKKLLDSVSDALGLFRDRGFLIDELIVLGNVNLIHVAVIVRDHIAVLLRHLAVCSEVEAVAMRSLTGAFANVIKAERVKGRACAVERGLLIRSPVVDVAVLLQLREDIFANDRLNLSFCSRRVIQARTVFGNLDNSIAVL